MYQVVFLFYCFSLGASSPKQSAQGNWPWLTKSGQPVTPSYGQSNGFIWPNSRSNSGGREDPRGEGWGPGSSSSTFRPGSSSSSWGSSGDSVWGSRRCGVEVRRSRCAPSVFEIERQLIGAAEKMAAVCTAYTDRPLREIYGIEHFKLRVRLQEFSEDDIQVRVRQRLVTVLASTCSAEYAAVRILPDVVDARRAFWKMDGDTLTVLFPYNITPNTEIQSRCGREFHGDPIIVPKTAAGTQFAQDYDLNFTDAAFRQAVRRALQKLNEDSLEYVVG